MSSRTVVALFSLLLSIDAGADVVTREVSYKAGDTVMQGLVAYDDSVEGKRPGVLVVHEWWGRNEYACGRAEQLAGMGYVGVAIDLANASALSAFRLSTEAPQAQSIAVHTAQKGAVVDQAPGKQTVKTVTE